MKNSLPWICVCIVVLLGGLAVDRVVKKLAEPAISGAPAVNVDGNVTLKQEGLKLAPGRFTLVGISGGGGVYELDTATGELYLVVMSGVIDMGTPDEPRFDATPRQGIEDLLKQDDKNG
jgi:hypothetical protein